MQKKSLYVHIPFCLKKCLFCSFVVSIAQFHRTDEYVQALETEAVRYKSESVETVYWGGGTPTTLSEEQIERFVNFIRKNFAVDANAEWTIEANPENLEPAKTGFLRSMGFNRISIGVQTFDERYLKFLGRNHDGESALRAYDVAREAGFKNINLDLMFSFPGQTIEELARDVSRLTSLKSEHVSLYSLTIDENSRFYAQSLKLDDQDLRAQHYLFICEELKKAGLHQYEVSNFSRPGFVSIHNSNYWTGRPYIGLGVGAHGFLDNRRYWNVPKLNDYLERIRLDQQAVEGFEDLSLQTRLMERVLIGLRRNEGINIAAIEKDIGLSLGEDRKALLRDLIDQGFLEGDNGWVKTTLKGRLVLDEISSRLI